MVVEINVDELKASGSDSGFEVTIESIRNILQTPRVDLVQLRSLSRSRGGYQSNSLRRVIWPKLVGINRFDCDVPDPKAYISKHNDDFQVLCDVTRLWGSLRPMMDRSDSYQSQRR